MDLCVLVNGSIHPIFTDQKIKCTGAEALINTSILKYAFNGQYLGGQDGKHREENLRVGVPGPGGL